jgi:hypothetical protein
MALSLYADRVRETTVTSGTGSVSLAGAVALYQSFASAFTSGQEVAYALFDPAVGWEVGIGTFTTGSISRDVVTDGTGGPGVHISLSGGTTQVFNTAPAVFFQTMPFNPWWYGQFGGL